MGRMWIKYGNVNGKIWDTEGSIWSSVRTGCLVKRCKNAYICVLCRNDSRVYKDEHNKLNTVGWGTLKSVINQNETGPRMNGCWIHVNWIQK